MVRGLFLLFGKIRSVFVQRARKPGRIFRFGFIRFASEVDAVSAIKGLDGLKMGGAALSVTTTKFPRFGGLKAKKKDVSTRAPLKKICPVAPQSWRQVLVGNLPENRLRYFLEAEQDFVSDVGRQCVEDRWLPDEILFPETAIWKSGVLGLVAEPRSPVEALFPEVVPRLYEELVQAGEDSGVGGKALVEQPAIRRQRQLGENLLAFDDNPSLISLFMRLLLGGEMTFKEHLIGNSKLCLSLGEGISIRTYFGEIGVALSVSFGSSTLTRPTSASSSYLSPSDVPPGMFSQAVDSDAVSGSSSDGDLGVLMLSSGLCCWDQEKDEVEGAAEMGVGDYVAIAEAEVGSVSFPRRPRGRPKKIEVKKKEVKRTPLDVPRQPRGRPKKPKVSAAKENLQALPCGGGVGDVGDAGALGRELLVLPVLFSEPYGIMTRARSAVLMGKRLGMVFDCSDEVASHQIASQIIARRCS